MKIEVITTFLDGTECFTEGEVRVVEDSRGTYFVEHGWAIDLDGNVESGTVGDGPVDYMPVSLMVDDIFHGTE